MKLKELESILYNLETFRDPDIRLEQYQTPADISAPLLHKIVQERYNDIEGKLVADLGCGCGTFAIGASLLGAGMCIGFDIDRKALDVSRLNAQEVASDNVDFIETDVLNMESRWTKTFDTVIMNPPFGTKNNRGIDLLFLKTALQLARNAVYTMHKLSTRKHLVKVAKSWKVEIEELHELQFNIGQVYKKYTKDKKDIEVVLLRFIPRS